MFKGKTYIEYSMSGSGLHILGIGNLGETVDTERMKLKCMILSDL